MTLEFLNQYRQIKREIKDLEQKIKELNAKKATIVSDTVIGSATEYPHVSHIISIAGYRGDRKLISKTQRLDAMRRNRLAKLLAIELEIEEYMDSITDSLLRRIITHRFIDGHSWRKVAHMIGHRTTDEQYPRRVIERHFESCTNCTKKT